jgi:hypothetical protein
MTDLFNVFESKFNNDTHNVVLSNEDDLYSYAHAKFMQYADEISKEYGVTSEDLDDGVEWYDEYHDEVVLSYCNKLNK